MDDPGSIPPQTPLSESEPGDESKAVSPRISERVRVSDLPWPSPSTYPPAAPMPSLELVTGALVGAAIAVSSAVIPTILLKPPVFDLPPLPAAFVASEGPTLPTPENSPAIDSASDAGSGVLDSERQDASDPVLLDPSRLQTEGVEVVAVVESLKGLDGKLRACRDAAVQEDASVTGEMMFRISLRADGSVESASVYEDSGQAPSLKACLVRVLKKAKIEPAPGHVASVVVPYWFD